ncbi:MAG: transcription antitermination factor NusB [Treponema sp.]|jgi:N utilization substance protein B|nr:transcription antitermination factor NusB [Treponema sp.]
MASRRKGRILAFQALYCWETTHVPADELAAFLWLESGKKAALNESVASFSRLLIAGTIENIRAIDDMIKKHLQHWDISRVGRVDLAILRISVYTLMFQPEIAPSIVIDEAIGIAKEFGTDESFRFINGVLDSIRRTLQEPPQ